MPRVLHIEDDPANRLLVKKLLVAAGFEVDEATDGLEGIRRALAVRPDLVLVDINIPHLDGYEVTLRLRGEASLAGVPIVAITAEGDRETSLVVGCDGFLQKPIDARTFARTVAGFLQGGERRPSERPRDDDRLRQQSQRIVAHLEEKVEELSSANARLRDLDRARTAFYRNISHELATPMTPIVGYLKLLGDGELGPLTKGQAKALAAMQGCATRLRTLIDNLLDVSGLETGKMKFFARDYDLAAVIEQADEGARQKLDARGLRMLTEMPDAELAGFGDADRLTRAIGQLLDNAAKFAPEGTTVALRVEADERRFRILVADEGPGIPEDRRERIFEPFFQVDASPTREHGGVGVGLSIVRRVAAGFDGTVRVLPPGEVVGGETFAGACLLVDIARRVTA